MSASTVVRRPPSGSLAEVVDIILDKGLVIDAFARVSLVGIELLTVDARVVVASVDTYLHFAEAVNRLDLRGKTEEHDQDLGDLVGGGMTETAAGAKTRGALDAAGDKTRGVIESGAERIRSAFGSEESSEESEESEKETSESEES